MLALFTMGVGYKWTILGLQKTSLLYLFKKKPLAWRLSLWLGTKGTPKCFSISAVFLDTDLRNQSLVGNRSGA